jgi:hypothetical protein
MPYFAARAQNALSLMMFRHRSHVLAQFLFRISRCTGVRTYYADRALSD